LYLGAEDQKQSFKKIKHLPMYFAECDLLATLGKEIATYCIVETVLSSHAPLLCLQAQAQVRPDRLVVSRAGRQQSTRAMEDDQK